MIHPSELKRKRRLEKEEKEILEAFTKGMMKEAENEPTEPTEKHDYWHELQAALKELDNCVKALNSCGQAGIKWCLEGDELKQFWAARISAMEFLHAWTGAHKVEVIDEEGTDVICS